MNWKNEILKARNEHVVVEKQKLLINSNQHHFANYFRSIKNNRHFYSAVGGLFAIGLLTISSCNVSSAKDSGTYDDSKIALKETQKIFVMLSINVNKGYQSVQYVNQYEIARDKIFNID